MFNPLIQLDHQRNDILESLRGEIGFWLSQPNHTQKLLAERAGMLPQVVNDIIQHRRGCNPVNYEKLVKAIRSGGTRHVNGQRFGQPVEDLAVDIAEFNADQTEQHLDHIRKSGMNHNADTTFSGRTEQE
jgi:hypothetical protein